MTDLFCLLAGTITAGQLLCGGLVSQDPLSNWFVSVALMHAMVDSTSQKEHLLRVQLVNRAGGTPIFLMQQLTSMLMQGGKTQPRVGLLMLLCTWLANCSLAVAQFLGAPTNVPYVSFETGPQTENCLGLFDYRNIKHFL